MGTKLTELGDAALECEIARAVNRIATQFSGDSLRNQAAGAVDHILASYGMPYRVFVVNIIDSNAEVILMKVDPQQLKVTVKVAE